MPTDLRYTRILDKNNYIEGYPNLLFDDECVMMTQEDYDRLPDYTASRPTGITVGKVWRNGNGFFTFQDYDPPRADAVMTKSWPIVIV